MLFCNNSQLTRSQDLLAVLLQMVDQLNTQGVSGEKTFHLDQEVHGLA